MLLVGAALHAQKSAVFITGTTAIRGYHEVTYFTEHTSLKGIRDLSFGWNGSTWYFSTGVNLDSFITNPEQFAPQFGSYCAFGMADGHKALTDPLSWSIVNDKRYLNYDKEVQAIWKEKQEEYIHCAEKNWPVLKDKE